MYSVPFGVAMRAWSPPRDGCGDGECSHTIWAHARTDQMKVGHGCERVALGTCHASMGVGLGTVHLFGGSHLLDHD